MATFKVWDDSTASVEEPREIDCVDTSEAAAIEFCVGYLAEGVDYKFGDQFSVWVKDESGVVVEYRVQPQIKHYTWRP